MTVYLGKDRECVTGTITATDTTVVGLKTRIKNAGHKLFMDNFFSSPDLFDNFHTETISCCGTVRLNRKGMLQDFRKDLKWGDIKSRVNLTAMIWKDKRDVNMET